MRTSYDIKSVLEGIKDGDEFPFGKVPIELSSLALIGDYRTSPLVAATVMAMFDIGKDYEKAAVQLDEIEELCRELGLNESCMGVIEGAKDGLRDTWRKDVNERVSNYMMWFAPRRLCGECGRPL